MISISLTDVNLRFLLRADVGSGELDPWRSPRHAAVAVADHAAVEVAVVDANDLQVALLALEGGVFCVYRDFE